MSDDQWEPITDAHHMLRVGIDQIRRREYYASKGRWGEWTPWEFVAVGRTVETAIAGFLSHSFEFRQPRQQPIESQQPPEPEQPVLSAGSKYKRLLHQTLPEGHAGAAVIVDVYDVLRAWDVTCPAIQHAIKKLLQPGQRGSKSAVQDLREAIGSIERAIQLLGDG